ncbi:MAG: Histone acetyltransferase HPA2 and related acetyltransferases, partial [uncultured Corynebacteriales bacterium]
ADRPAEPRHPRLPRRGLGRRRPGPRRRPAAGAGGVRGPGGVPVAGRDGRVRGPVRRPGVGGLRGRCRGGLRRLRRGGGDLALRGPVPAGARDRPGAAAPRARARALPGHRRGRDHGAGRQPGPVALRERGLPAHRDQDRPARRQRGLHRDRAHPDRPTL